MIVSAPSLAQLLVAPFLAIAVVLALGVVLMAVADAAGKRRERRTLEALTRERLRSRERGEGSWERKRA